jgi:hypothetical protein
VCFRARFSEQCVCVCMCLCVCVFVCDFETVRLRWRGKRSEQFYTNTHTVFEAKRSGENRRCAHVKPLRKGEINVLQPFDPRGESSLQRVLVELLANHNRVNIQRSQQSTEQRSLNTCAKKHRYTPESIEADEYVCVEWSLTSPLFTHCPDATRKEWQSVGEGVPSTFRTAILSLQFGIGVTGMQKAMWSCQHGFSHTHSPLSSLDSPSHSLARSLA